MVTKENITGKQRAYLRSLANKVPSIFQIGKDGISDNLIKQLSDALNARELIKIHVSEKKERLAEEARRKEKEIQKNQNELIKQIGIIFDERLQIVKEAIALLLEKDSNQSGSNNTDEGYTDIDNSKTSS